MSLLLPLSPTGGKGGVRGKRGTPEKERLPLYYVNNPTMRLTKSSEKSLRKRIDPIAAINSALRLVELLTIEERLLNQHHSAGFLRTNGVESFRSPYEKHG